MSTMIDSVEITRVSVIDDDPPARDSYELTLEDLGLQAVPENGPLGDMNTCIGVVRSKADAALCDHHLKVKAYSMFNGAELVAKLYQLNFPAVLCTNWNNASVDEMRPFRRFIASLVDPKTLDPHSLRYGLESCIMEFKGDFRAVRRPWRTLVRVEDMPEAEQGVPFIYVAVPAWSAEIVRLPSTVFPEGIRKALAPGFRLHAKVNLGASGHEELFFEDWE
jgi:CheY-like chemotaxis protein